MGVIAEYLQGLIAKQVEDHGLVVWYDPEKAYAAVVEHLDLPGTQIARYQGSFFRLRREIDHLMNDEQPPRLVVYVPLAREQTHHALVELEAAGVVMRPGQQPPARNTKLAVVARHALRSILADEHLAEIEKQIENGKLTLSDLEALADKGKGISHGMLALIFGTTNPQEVALSFLASDRYDEELTRKAATEELARLLASHFDLPLPSPGSLPSLRAALARHVLLTDLRAGLGKHVPSALASLRGAASPAGVDACVRLARSWRNSREHQKSYQAAASQFEADLHIRPSSFDLAGLATEPPEHELWKSETLLSFEQALLRYVEGELGRKAAPRWLQLATARQSRYWAEVEPGVQFRWALIAAAAAVLLEADHVAQSLKKPPADLAEWVKAYAEGERPWCLLDTYHRHLESRKHSFDFDPGNEHAELEKLITRAEQRYLDVGSALAQQFVKAVHKAKYPVAGLLRQRDCFKTQVAPRLGEGKVAYVWVDALRFEMARELVRVLADDFDVTLSPALGTVPTITEIGMAALLPRADEPTCRVVAVGGGKLGLEIAGRLIKDRKDRVAFLEEHAGVPVFACKLDDLLPKPGKRVREGIEQAGLVLVTSQEIDELCEGDNITQARLQMDGILKQLPRGVRILKNQGVKTVILAADHGHWFAEEVGEDMKIEAPGGRTEDLRRRVWVGHGGASNSSYLRVPIASLGIDSDLDLATPWTFACFRSKGGARAYFHGGLSPQELVVPVLALTCSRKALPTSAEIQWQVIPGTAKLTTRFLCVQVRGTLNQPDLYGLQPPRVRVEIRAHRKCVSTPMSASYDYLHATGEVQMRLSEKDPGCFEPNTVTLMITEEITHKTVSIHLLDANTGMELASPVNLDVAISL